MIRNFGSSGITNQPTGLDIGVGGSNIKSIQTGEFNFPNATSYDITITGIDISKSIIIVEAGAIINNGTTDTTWISGIIVNSTTIRFLRGTAYADSPPVHWKVIEFNNIKSKQSGSISMGGLSSTTQSITTIDASKSIVFWSQRSTSAGLAVPISMVTRAILTNSQITFKKYNASDYSLIIEWQVINFI